MIDAARFRRLAGATEAGGRRMLRPLIRVGREQGTPTRFFAHHFDSAPWTTTPTSLLEAARSVGPRLTHVAMFAGNAGDRLLPTAVRDLTALALPGVRWTPMHVHRSVDDSRLARINSSDGLIIGGGGLFLSDTNPNPVSGWQWPISPQSIDRIAVPTAVMAVGYNRFRGQKGFSDEFRRSVAALVEKSVFVGLRNTGSIEQLSAELPDELGERLRFQPCPTTVLQHLYPSLFPGPDSTTRGANTVVAVNCAFDRAASRYGERESAFVSSLTSALRTIQNDHRVEVFAHTASDERIVPYLARAGIRCEVKRLYRSSPLRIIEEYREPLIVLGMRGHAQMIPFGCGRPIYSLVSHDKMLFFLRDAGLEDLGAEVGDPDLAERLVAAVGSVADSPQVAAGRIATAQQRLWDISVGNLDIIRRRFGEGL
jgi:polysaccharide pyruvyl transferase WcaK-like protein